jgi:hypothetical protein
MECKISEDAFVQLLYEFDIKGLGVLDVCEEPVNVLHAILAAPEVVVRQFAELWAITDILEPHLPDCAHAYTGIYRYRCCLIRNNNNCTSCAQRRRKTSRPM